MWGETWGDRQLHGDAGHQVGDLGARPGHWSTLGSPNEKVKPCRTYIRISLEVIGCKSFGFYLRIPMVKALPQNPWPLSPEVRWSATNDECCFLQLFIAFNPEQVWTWSAHTSKIYITSYAWGGCGSSLVSIDPWGSDLHTPTQSRAGLHAGPSTHTPSSGACLAGPSHYPQK